MVRTPSAGPKTTIRDLGFESFVLGLAGTRTRLKVFARVGFYTSDRNGQRNDRNLGRTTQTAFRMPIPIGTRTFWMLRRPSVERFALFLLAVPL